MVYVMNIYAFGYREHPEIRSHRPGWLQSRDTNTWAPSPWVRATADSGNVKHGGALSDSEHAGTRPVQG